MNLTWSFVFPHVQPSLASGCFVCGLLLFCLCCSERAEGGGSKGAKAKWIPKPFWAKKCELQVDNFGLHNKHCTNSPWQQWTGNSCLWQCVVSYLVFLLSYLTPTFSWFPSLSLTHLPSPPPLPSPPLPLLLPLSTPHSSLPHFPLPSTSLSLLQCTSSLEDHVRGSKSSSWISQLTRAKISGGRLTSLSLRWRGSATILTRKCWHR